MAIEKIFKDGVREFIIIANLSEEKELYRAAVSNYFKALVELCDFILLRQIKKISKNHNERFELLREHKYKVFLIVSSLFKSYTDTYTNYSTKEICGRIKNGIKQIIKLEGLETEFKEIIEKI